MKLDPDGKLLMKINTSKRTCNTLLLLFLISAQGFTQAPTNGLVLHYAFSGNLVDQQAGNNAISNGGSFTSDRFGSANSAFYLSRDRSESLVSTSSLGVSGNTSRTVSFWLKLDSAAGLPAGNIYIATWGSPGQINGGQTNILYNTAGGGSRLAFNGNGADARCDFTSASNVGSWKHIAFVYGGNLGSALFYVNGVAQGTTIVNGSSSTQLQTVNTQLRINGVVDYPNQGFVGSIDEFRVYNRALSASEISQLYVAESTQPNTPPSISTQPLAQVVSAGGTASFSVIASGSPTLSYQWLKGGSAISGANSSVISLNSVTASDAGTYSVIVSNSAGSVVSSAVTLTVNPAQSAPSIIGQPASQTVVAGSSASFTVSATGAPPPSFQWLKGGSAISGATLSTLTIANASPIDSGSYSVLVSNPVASVVSSVATLTVSPAAVAPAVISQPTSQVVTAGESVIFNIMAVGTPTPTYQWLKNGGAIAGATSATLQLTSVSGADAGTYSVIVSNSGGSLISSGALLTVKPASSLPSIVSQPSSQSVSPGSPVVFAVTATGSPAPVYQWQKNGANIAGATSSSYTISSAFASDAGSFNVVISNAAGSVNSAVATLSILPSSSLTNLSVRTNMGVGQTLIVGAVVAGGRKNIVIRCGGPVLNIFGLSGLADPRLEIYTGGITPAVSNDDWPAYLSTTFDQIGAFQFPSGSRDAAIATSISGSFTAQARGSGSGTVLVEAYATDLFVPQAAGNSDHTAILYARSNSAPALPPSAPFPPSPPWSRVIPTGSSQALWSVQANVRNDNSGLSPGSSWGNLTREVGDGGLTFDPQAPRLINLSARNFVGTGSNILIAGFAITGTGSKQLLIRAVGPALSAFGVAGALQDPQLSIYGSNGAIVASNDNWDATSATFFSQAGAFPLQSGSRDAAVIVTLPAGSSYTAQVSGVAGLTGEALVEIYDIP